MADVRILASPQWEYLDMYGEWVAFERPPTRLAYGVVIGLPTGTPVMLILMLTFGVPPHYYLARNPFQTPVILRNYAWETESEQAMETEREAEPEQEDGLTAQAPKEEGSSHTSLT